MAAILAPVMTRLTRTQCPILANKIMTLMQLVRSQMSTYWLRIFFDRPCDSDEHTPAQESKRQRFSPVPSRQYMVDPSDSDDYDQLCDVPVRERKTGFMRPRIHWETVSSCSLDHVAQDDIDGEIARIMAKTMHDANIQVTPKYNSKAISHFRFKTVKDAISSVCSDTQQSNPCYLSTGIQLQVSI
jgi:hypothetical protein